MSLHITQGEERLISEDGARAPHLFKLRNNTLLLTCHVDPDMHFPQRLALRSVDGGKTWQKDTRRCYKEMAWGQDKKGTVLAFDRDTFEKRPGLYLGAYYRSDDGGSNFSGPHESRVYIDRVASSDYPRSPEHYPIEGPFQRDFYCPIPEFYRPVVERAGYRRGFHFWRYMLEQDGCWRTAMKGRFHGDVCGRSIIAVSKDQGKTWRFESMIAYEHDPLIDGLTEPALCRTADGSLLCVMRRHGRAKRNMVQCRSVDEGRTWSAPEALPAHGVDPDLCLLSNGVLACTYGRPGQYIMFSDDGCGYAWGYHTPIGAWRSSAMMGIAESAPNELLLVYDRVKGDPEAPKASRNTDNCYIGAKTLHVQRQ